VAGRTNDSAGDGTTTASVLAREMIHYGLQYVTAGANPINVKKGIDKTQEFLVAKLKENARPVQGKVDIRVSGDGGGSGTRVTPGDTAARVRGGRGRREGRQHRVDTLCRRQRGRERGKGGGGGRCKPRGLR
jgi:hypothetical protein